MQVLFSKYPSTYNYNNIIGLLGSTQRAAQNPSVIVAKEGIITTKHRQTLAQAAFNFQINDHRELLQSCPSVTKKKAKCFCLFLVYVCHTNHSRLEKSSDQTPINVNNSSFEVFQINHNRKLLQPFSPFSIKGQPL